MKRVIMIAPRGITGVTQEVTTEDRLCILVNLVARLGVLWHEHAVVIREEDPRGSCALINAADELTTLVEKYFGDVFHMPVWPEAFVPSRLGYSALLFVQCPLLS